MSFMNKDQYTDPGLFELFLTNNVWQEYAETFLDPEQIDDTDNRNTCPPLATRIKLYRFKLAKASSARLRANPCSTIAVG